MGEISFYVRWRIVGRLRLQEIIKGKLIDLDYTLYFTNLAIIQFTYSLHFWHIISFLNVEHSIHSQ